MIPSSMRQRAPSHNNRTTAAREAFRQRRLADRERRLAQFYLEHNLLSDAQQSRTVMLGHLRSACEQWRLILGIRT